MSQRDDSDLQAQLEEINRRLELVRRLADADAKLIEVLEEDLAAENEKQQAGELRAGDKAEAWREAFAGRSREK